MMPIDAYQQVLVQRGQLFLRHTTPALLLPQRFRPCRTQSSRWAASSTSTGSRRSSSNSSSSMPL